ncbi:Heat Shock transcription factor [Ectocarpus siliculosus]|uniref:Heat Shock transcription factor n=1 Tax=Ectocarpus siliculosus TaxID=2880 RepID=D7FUT8_ECTSI|nr:Heat Shock transcription factor [Ectocarpus siliculosus]|eukprot:CBJ31744.1 Heat Shock transcription factor [Ectocarpus siliculosus]
MRPTPVKFQDAEEAPSMKQHQAQHEELSSTGGGGGTAFSPTRRVGARGGPQLFAQKLFTLVEEEDSEIVEWLPDGLAFRVKDIQRFSCEVLEKYFNHSKFTSFQRQLNLYQFKRRKGAHAGAFHHPSFRRGQRHLLSKVRRQKVSDDEEFGPAAAGSRRSALRRRVDSGTGGGARYVQDGSSNGGDESSNDETWPTQSTTGGLERVSSGDSEDDRLCWGQPDNMNNHWREQVPGSPARSPTGLHHVLTPTTMTSPSDYELSPVGDFGGLDRTSSVSSSLASSLSFSSAGSSSPSQSDTTFDPSSPYLFHDTDCDESGGHSDPIINRHSPMSIHSPVGQAVATVQAAAAKAAKAAAAKATQASPSMQQHDQDLSLAAVVGASLNGWNSPHQSSPLSHLEQFGWGAANIAIPGDAGAPWSPEPSPASGVPIHHQLSHASPHQEDFGFIDLFAANWDPNDGGSAPSSSPASSTDSGVRASSPPDNSKSGGGGGGGGGGDGRSMNNSDAFLKEAQAAGVFIGVEDLLVPRSTCSVGGAAGSYGPVDFA